MRFIIVTLGCKVNQYESQAMEKRLTERGLVQAGPGEDFDLAIVNTCTVTAVADKKNRNVIRRLRKQCPEAVLAVCGCYSQIKPEDVRALGADVISGSGGREAFLDLVLETLADRQKREALDEALRRRDFEVLPAGGLAARTRAMLKVQDGCSNFCSYCIIPYARGPVRSLPLAEALEQAQALAAEGYREIVVTGIEIASWGWDFHDGSRLPALIDALCAAVPEVRVRLGSLEPRIVDEAFCRLNRHRNLCPHFHLSMQSGSDGVLARMRRKYDTARYYESVRLLKEHFPGCAVTTDMIVGFPGETEAEFEESLAFIRRCGFAAMHIFPYSRRPGTPADQMPGQLGNAVKEARSAAAIAAAAEMNRAFREGMVGTVQEVLFEEQAQAFPLRGRCPSAHTGADEVAPDEATGTSANSAESPVGSRCESLTAMPEATSHAFGRLRQQATGDRAVGAVIGRPPEADAFDEGSGSREQGSGDGGADPSTPLRSAQDDNPVGGGALDAPLWTGHAPNSIRVYAPGTDLHNQVLPVRITGLYEDGLLGEIVR